MASRVRAARLALRIRHQGLDRSNNGPRSQRGMVLVMTLLMLSMLAVLGSAAVMRSAMNLRDGGALRVERAAYRLSEAGALASVMLASQMQGGFAEYAKQKPEGLTMADMGDGMLSLKGSDSSFGSEFMAVGNVGFIAKVGEPELSSSVPGYDAGRYCFESYRIVTTSSVGTVANAPSLKAPIDKADAALAARVSGEAAIATQMMIGPVVCGQ